MARCVVAIKARPTLASALCGGCYRLCLSARMSVSSVHLTQHNGRVEERGLAAGGLKACARVEHSHGVVAVHVRWGASSAQSWEGRRTSVGSWVREQPGSGSGLIVVLPGAGRREHVQGGKARQARQRR